MTAGLCVLYVDDDDDIRTITCMALRMDSEFEVRAASSAEEALALLDQTDWRPDVILLDVMMPGMDGFALQSALRERENLRGAVTIFMTARASRAGLEEYTASGADGVILKPFDPLQLASEMRAIAARAKS